MSDKLPGKARGCRIKVYGSVSSSRGYEIRSLLARSVIPFEWAEVARAKGSCFDHSGRSHI